MKEVFSPIEIDQFITDGFLRLDHAFSPEIAAAVRERLWKDIPDNRIQPVVRLGMYSEPPFIEAANTPLLHAAFDQLVGIGRWAPCRAMGTFPVRFPAPQDAGDTGWHVDVSFPGDDPANYFSWRSNISSKGRALLMLFLFSDIGPDDAPTRIRKGSHLDVARALAPHGDKGLSFMELASMFADMPAREEALATGAAGTVYLCHPFLVHAAQPHRGKEVRFLAQPPLLFKGVQEADPQSAVGLAIRAALK